MVGFDENLKDDLVTSYYSVSVSDDTIYSTKFNIDNIQIIMVCGYNSRNKLRWVSLTDIANNVILPQTFLKRGKKCELNFNSNVIGLDYCLTLKRLDQTKDFPENFDYINWAKDFELLFVGNSYSLTLRLENNHRKMIVGN